MADKRTGQYGSYYGSTYNSSEALTDEQMSLNVEYIHNYLTDKGWTTKAISALCGNMQAESTINPGRWQSEDVGNTSMGYSLVQWTPASKYIGWCNSEGLSDPSEMDNALARICFEVANGLQWISTSSHNLSFEEFITSEADIAYLATAFLLNYERPADQSESVQAYRSTLALQWYEMLKSKGDNADVGDKKKTKRKRYNFVLFNQRRRNQWIRNSF